MGIGKIASFLSSLSPASDAAATTASADEVPEDFSQRADALSEHPDLDHRAPPRSDPNSPAAQLQTMVGAVRALNDNAVEHGAAVAVSSAGTQLKNAVTALGHLLAAVDAQALAQGAAGPVRDAANVIDEVEAGLDGSQTAFEKILSQLPAHQAVRAQVSRDTFQAEMRDAIGQARAALDGLRRL